MKARWEEGELATARVKGVWRGWAAGDSAEIDSGWLVVSFWNRRIYAPTEHPALPSDFAALAQSTPERIREFASF